MKTTRRQLLSVIFAATSPVALTAQVPYALLHSIPSPPLSVQTGAEFGTSVAVDGTYTVVGAPRDDTGALDSGVAKVFDSTTGALLFVLANPTPATSDNFGFSVAISGTRVVVGARLDYTGFTAAGSAYVYDLSSATPTVPMFTLNNPNFQVFLDAGLPAVFGGSVAIDGTRVVVGASGADATAGWDVGGAFVYDLSSATPTDPVAELNNPSPAGSDNFGYSVAISGTRVVVGAFGDNTGAGDAGSAYIYDLSSGTPTVPVATLNNPSPASNDHFGFSAAISGTSVMVGAYSDDTGARDAGSAYVYDLNNSTPLTPVFILNNPGPAVNDQFGVSVAIDGTRAVAGASTNVTGGTLAGSAYVYDLSSSTPTVPVATLDNPSPAFDDQFGRSVVLSGTRLVVGAYGDDSGTEGSGSAYIYDFSSGTPTLPVFTLNDPGPAAADFFGVSVAISGTRLVVGADHEDTGAIESGSAYVYDLSSVTPTVPVMTLNNPSPAAGDTFGYAVAISGALVVVGAFGDSTGATNAGSAYVYDLGSATPTMPVVTLNNPGPAAGDVFGLSVAISGTRVVVGSLNDDTGASDAGSAYVYDLSSATPTVPVATLNNPSPAEFDRFGFSVAISGTRVVVGSLNDDTGASDAGSAYMYDLSSATPTVPVTTLNNPSPATDDRFSWSVAISGTRVVVGAWQDDPGATNAGSAYVYDMSSGTPTVPAATLSKPSPAANDNFGKSVAISGTQVVVGADGDKTGAIQSGSAYVYDLSSGTPSAPVATLNNPFPAAQDYFGYSVAIEGTTVAVSTPYDDTVGPEKGSAYILGPASPPTDADNDGLLDSWELTYWPTTAGHGPLDDDDHDGCDNLLELAFGLNPTLSDARGLPEFTDEGGYLTVTITKQPGVIYEVQSANIPLPDSFSAANTTVIINNATTLKVRDTVPTASGPRRFLRVMVTAAP